MKTKEKEIQKKITELCDLMSEDDKFFVFRKNDNVVDIALPSEKGKVKDVHVSAALASVLEAYLLGNGGKGVDRLSEIIISAIEAVVGVSPLAGSKLTSRFAIASLLGLKKTMDELDVVNDEDEDEGEDCENCELLRTCENEAAIKYRKEHHIPKPKKNKNGGRKVDVN
jgi:hypothetical protein